MLSTHARVLLTSDAEILIWKKGMGTKMDGRKTRVQYSSQLTFLSLHTLCVKKCTSLAILPHLLLCHLFDEVYSRAAACVMT